MKRYLIFTMVFIIGVFFAYNYTVNDYKNVSIILTNGSFEDSIYVEVYWNKKPIITENVIYSFPAIEYKFNTNWGKHSLMIKENEFQEEYTLWVLPFLYANIEYCGINSIMGNKNKSPFFIRKNIFPLFFD